MKFALQFNGPHNLLIVYYAGHGSYDDRADKLELHAYVPATMLLRCIRNSQTILSDPTFKSR